MASMVLPTYWAMHVWQMAIDQVNHKAGLADEPVHHPVVRASEGASEPGVGQDLWAAETGSQNSGMVDPNYSIQEEVHL